MLALDLNRVDWVESIIRENLEEIRKAINFLGLGIEIWTKIFFLTRGRVPTLLLTKLTKNDAQFLWKDFLTFLKFLAVRNFLKIYFIYSDNSEFATFPCLDRAVTMTQTMSASVIVTVSMSRHGQDTEKLQTRNCHCSLVVFRSFQIFQFIQWSIHGQLFKQILRQYER